ncbi:MAG: DNA polymerase IV [Candidatus Falkowbacteria bacterium]
MEKIIMHIDMNSYFASVEQQANPFLRGKPVGVCAYLSPRGCIIASSKEAKAFGIKTGSTVAEARALCPSVILLENEPAKYRATTERIFRILEEYTDRMEPYSIDEAFLDLSGWSKDLKAAAEIAKTIRGRIKKEAGEYLACSIGLARTKFLAKFAGDTAPKGGMVAITGENLDAVLAGRALTDAWGINTRMEARFNSLGIRSLSDLKNYDGVRIRRSLGRYGYYLWAGVNGIEITSVLAGAPPPKSVGHSYCLPKKTADKKYLGSVLYKLCEKTGRRLRASGMEARNITVGLSYVGEGGEGRSRKTADTMFTTEEIAAEALAFLAGCRLLMPVRLLAVSVSALAPVTGQMSLFGGREKGKNLSRALDRINDKFGEYTVARGRMFGREDAARDRIGFRKIS